MCLLKPNGWKFQGTVRRGKEGMDPGRQPKMLTIVTPSETFLLTFDILFFGGRVCVTNPNFC